MNRNESKYFNTALKMQNALLKLLEKKDFMFINVKEICSLAEVNRSTFYLHYENTNDLLLECIEEINRNFLESFANTTINAKNITSANADDYNFINEKYLLPFLNFVKDNRRAFKLIHNIPDLFDTQKTYSKMFENIFTPILNFYNYPVSEHKYIIKYYSGGLLAIVFEWLDNDCDLTINQVCQLIIKCIH